MWWKLGLLSQLWHLETRPGPINLPKSSLKISGWPQSKVVCLVECWRCGSLGVCFKWVCSRCDLHSQQLEQVDEILRQRYPALVKWNRILLQEDNARPHTPQTNMTKIQEFAGIKLLLHPAYRSDLAPSDYHLFQCMAHLWWGRNFKNIEAVEVDLAEFFASKTRDWYCREIINLAEKWLKTIELEEYFNFLSENIQNKICLKN